MWSIGVKSFVLREIQMWTQISGNISQKMSKKGWFFKPYHQFFQNLIWLAFNLMLDWWPLWFIWYHDLRVINCQSIAMIFVFTQYSFWNSFRQGLIHPCPKGRSPSAKTWPKFCFMESLSVSMISILWKFQANSMGDFPALNQNWVQQLLHFLI